MQKLCLFGISFLLIPFADVVSAAWDTPDAGCELYGAWQIQSSVRSDLTGLRNVAYPESSATYWGSLLTQPPGTVVTVKGRYPRARYMAVQLYDEQRNVIGAINDQDIQPDAGTNNPFRTGTDQGKFTVQIVFGRTPVRPAVNTIYTGNLTKVVVLYRIYYSDSASDLTAGTFDPVLPDVAVSGTPLATCPSRPIVSPEELTVWGRIDDGEWVGSVPAPGGFRLVTTNPPTWILTVTNRLTPYYPSADNTYMTALISREYLLPPYSNDLAVIRMRAPGFPDTQSGEAPYLALTDRQVRFWSICQYDPVSTGVNRCVADNQAINTNGFITVVISDPSKKPAAAILLAQGARWMPWGALQNGDFVYDVNLNRVGNEKPVYYYGSILYRQTLSNPAWDKSMFNIGNNYPRSQWKTAMGDYWPTIGYCTLNNFAVLGANCFAN